jgi:hypothetical protein
MLKLPVDWFQLLQVLEAHQRWLEVLLGEAHVVSSYLIQLLGILDHMAATHDIHPSAEIMCGIHTYTWSWAD